MPSLYTTSRDKAKKFIEDFLIPIIRKKDVDYYKAINTIIAKTGISKKSVKDAVGDLIDLGEIAECRVLTVKETQIPELLKEMREIEKEAEKELEGVKNV